MKTITARVPLRGIASGESTIQITTNGFTGTGCTDATRAIEAALGTVVEDQPTPEMYDVEPPQERLTDG